MPNTQLDIGIIGPARWSRQTPRPGPLPRGEGDCGAGRAVLFLHLVVENGLPEGVTLRTRIVLISLREMFLTRSVRSTLEKRGEVVAVRADPFATLSDLRGSRIGIAAVSSAEERIGRARGTGRVRCLTIGS